MLLVRYIALFKKSFYINTVLTNYRLAMNESNKISTVKRFFDKDKKIREHFILLYPKLKKMINQVIPLIEYNQIFTINHFVVSRLNFKR